MVWALLVQWFVNYSARLGVHGASVDLTPAQVGSMQSAIGNLIQSHNQVIQKESELMSLREQCNSMRIVPMSTPFDPALFMPEFTVEVQPGQVLLNIKRNYMPALNVDARLAGQQAWTFLDTSLSTTFINSRPLAQPLVGEVREYQLVGYMDNQKVGSRSPILCAAFMG